MILNIVMIVLSIVLLLIACKLIQLAFNQSLNKKLNDIDHQIESINPTLDSIYNKLKSYNPLFDQLQKVCEKLLFFRQY